MLMMTSAGEARLLRIRPRVVVRDLLPLGEAEDARCRNGDEDVERDECDEDAEVAPAVVEGDAERLVEVVSGSIRAELAGRRGIGVVDVPADLVDVALCVRQALLAAGRVEYTELPRRTLDVQAVHLSDDETSNETGEGVELVHPHTPEVGHLALDDRDTTEQTEHDEQEGVERRRDLDAGRY